MAQWQRGREAHQAGVVDDDTYTPTVKLDTMVPYFPNTANFRILPMREKNLALLCEGYSLPALNIIAVNGSSSYCDNIVRVERLAKRAWATCSRDTSRHILMSKLRHKVNKF